MVIMMLRIVLPSEPLLPPEGDVEVVAQPSGQRDVPAAPEVLQVARGVGRVEVDGEPDAEQEGEPDGDVGVPAEVAVDLHGVAPGREDHLGRGVLRGVGEDRVDDGARHVRRDHHLLEQAGHDQPQGPRVVDLVGVASLRSLGQELVAPHDRSGQQVREEGEVEGQVDRTGRLHAPR